VQSEHILWFKLMVLNVDVLRQERIGHFMGVESYQVVVDLIDGRRWLHKRDWRIRKCGREQATLWAPRSGLRIAPTWRQSNKTVCSPECCECVDRNYASHRLEYKNNLDSIPQVHSRPQAGPQRRYAAQGKFCQR